MICPNGRKGVDTCRERVSASVRHCPVLRSFDKPLRRSVGHRATKRGRSHRPRPNSERTTGSRRKKQQTLRQLVPRQQPQSIKVLPSEALPYLRPVMGQHGLFPHERCGRLRYRQRSPSFLSVGDGNGDIGNSSLPRHRIFPRSRSLRWGRANMDGWASSAATSLLYRSPLPSFGPAIQPV